MNYFLLILLFLALQLIVIIQPHITKTNQYKNRNERFFFSGCNEDYQMGRDDIYGQCLSSSENMVQGFEPIQYENGLKNFTNVKKFCQTEAGSMITLIDNEKGDIIVWGNSLSGILGESLTASSPIPQKLYNPNLENNDFVEDVKCGAFSAEFLTNEKKLYGWGQNNQHFGIDVFISVFSIGIPVLIENNVVFFDVTRYSTTLSKDYRDVKTSGKNNEFNYGRNVGQFDVHQDFRSIDYSNMNIVTTDTQYKLSNISITRRCGNILIFQHEITKNQVVYGYGKYSRLLLTGLIDNGDYEKIPILLDISLYINDLKVILQVDLGKHVLILVQFQNMTKRIYSWGSIYNTVIGRYYTGNNWIYPAPIEFGEMNQQDDIPLTIVTCQQLHVSVDSSLILTEKGKLFGFGDNYFLDLEKESQTYISLLPVRIADKYKILRISENYYNFRAILIEDFMCFGEWKDSHKVCSHKGNCSSENACICKDQNFGENCEIFSCFGKRSDNESCSNHGICLSSDKCWCQLNWGGYDCGFPMCHAILATNETVCSKNGNCTSVDNCECESEYKGKDCSVMKQSFLIEYWHYFVFPSSFLACMIVCFFFIALCFCCICRKQSKKIAKFSELKDFDILLGEQKAEESSSLANFNINKSLYEIDIADIKLVRQIGQGGSETVVYLAIWKHEKVAYKSFKTTSFITVQNNYDEFEKELSLVSSISNPYVLRFFGACISPPRIGLVFEYCPMGDLCSIIMMSGIDKTKTFQFQDRIRILFEISKGMDFLHSKNITHRDLKCANILLTENLTAKIIDFGISKILSSAKEFANLTKRIGTSYYMSPQITFGAKYTLKTDVFSYAMIIYETMNNRLAFGKAPPTGIEIAIGNNPNMRPKISKFDRKHNFKENKWLINLLEQCWKHSEEDRLSFKEIVNIFNREMKKMKFDDENEAKQRINELEKSILLLEKENAMLDKKLKRKKKS